MEKIKSFLKPGSNGDDDVLYGDGSNTNPNNMGKVSGEGSHFGTSTDSPSTATPSTAIDDTGNDASSTTAVRGGRPGETQEATGYTPHSGSRTAADKAWNEHSGQGVQRSNPDQAAYATSSDPRHGHDTLGQGKAATSGQYGDSTSTPIYQQFATSKGEESQPRSDYTGPGAAAAGGAGLAGAGAYAGTRDTDRTTSEATPRTGTTATSAATEEPSYTSSGGLAGAGTHANTRDTDRTTSETMPRTGATTTSAPIGEPSNLPEDGLGSYTGPVHDSAFLNKIDPRVKPTSESHLQSPEEQTARKIEPMGGTSMPASQDTSFTPSSGTVVDPGASSNTGGTGSYTNPTGTAANQETATHQPSYTDNSRSRAAETATGIGAGTGAAGAMRSHGDGLSTGDSTARSGYDPASSSAMDSQATRSGAHTKPIGTAVSTDSSGMPGAFPDSSNPYTQQAVDSRIDPSKSSTSDSHHYGRDAALGGAGLGAAGGAAYAADKHREQPAGSGTGYDTSRSLDQSTPSGPAGAGYDTQAGTGRHVAQEAGIPSSGREPMSGQGYTGQSSQIPETGRTQETHHGRDAALGAGALGAGGAAAYGLGRDSDRTHTGHDQAQLADRTGPGYDQVQTSREPGRDHGVSRDAALGTGAAGAGPAAAMYGMSSREQHPTATQSQYQQPTTHESARDQKDHHYGRDAAVGAGAAGAAAYGIDHEADRKKMEKEQAEQAKEAEKAQKEHSKELEKEHKKEEKQHEKEQKKAEKEHEKEVKHAEKEHEKEQKKHDKAVAAEIKEHEKEQEKAEKERQKEMEKYEKEHSKEEDEGEHKKKGGLFGFLHRDKSKKDTETEEESHGHGKEAAAVGAAGAAGAGAYEHEHHKDSGDRNRLHKDPPESSKYAQAPEKGYASTVTGGTGTTALAQGDNLPGGSHSTGAANRLDPAVADRGFAGQEQDMPTRYRDNVTGGTGTTDLAQGDNMTGGSHMTGAGNKLDPAVPARGSVGGSGEAGHSGSVVTDPRTGLPMDMSKGEHRGLGTDHLPAADRT